MPFSASSGLQAAIADLNDPEEDCDFVLMKYAGKRELILVEEGLGCVGELVNYLEDDQVATRQPPGLTGARR